MHGLVIDQISLLSAIIARWLHVGSGQVIVKIVLTGLAFSAGPQLDFLIIQSDFKPSNFNFSE